VQLVGVDSHDEALPLLGACSRQPASQWRPEDDQYESGAGWPDTSLCGSATAPLYDLLQIARLPRRAYPELRA
jgi:hypothetical protein